jgi:hypothetical protein
VTHTTPLTEGGITKIPLAKLTGFTPYFTVLPKFKCPLFDHDI